MELTYIQSRFGAFFTILEHLLKSSIKSHVGRKVRYGGWGKGLCRDGGLFNLAKTMVSVLPRAHHGSP